MKLRSLLIAATILALSPAAFAQTPPMAPAPGVPVTSAPPMGAPHVGGMKAERIEEMKQRFELAQKERKEKFDFEQGERVKKFEHDQEQRRIDFQARLQQMEQRH